MSKTIWNTDVIFTRSLKLVKLPCVGGLHDMRTVLPLRTETERFDGGSGAVKKSKRIDFSSIILLRVK